MAAAGELQRANPDDGLPVRGDKLSPSAVNRMLMEGLMYLGRAVVLLYPVYLTGYLGLSVSWVLLCMLMVTWWRKNRQWKDVRIGSAIHLVDNETRRVHAELHSDLQMASWVGWTWHGAAWPRRTSWFASVLVLQWTRAELGSRFRFD